MKKEAVKQSVNIQKVYQSFAVCFFVSLLCVVSAAQASRSTEEKNRVHSQTVDLISNIDAFNINDTRLRDDSARAHYNMGNIYFEKGEYEIAAREYYQAVTLMPNDADAHFNLAFVSSQHLEDYRTALKHYRMYLYLNPDAKDKSFVKGKIVEATLALRSIIDSPLETLDK